MTLQKELVAADVANTVAGGRLGRTYFEGFGKGERRNLAWLPGVWLDTQEMSSTGRRKMGSKFEIKQQD